MGNVDAQMIHLVRMTPKWYVWMIFGRSFRRGEWRCSNYISAEQKMVTTDGLGSRTSNIIVRPSISSSYSVFDPKPAERERYLDCHGHHRRALTISHRSFLAYDSTSRARTAQVDASIKFLLEQVLFMSPKKEGSMDTRSTYCTSSIIGS